MATLALLGGSLLGGLFGDKKKSSQKIDQTSSPFFSPEFSGLKDKLIANAMRTLGGSGGYNAAHNITNANLNNISMAGDSAQKGLAARLSSMGIRGQAAAMPQANLAGSVFGQHVGALNQEPILGRQFNQEDFQQAMAALGLGRGTHTTGTTTGTETGGGGIGGGLNDLGGMIGFLASNGMLNFGGVKKPGITGGGGGGAW